MTSPSIKNGISRVRTEYGDVILDETTGRYWHINPTAALVLDTVEQDGDTEHAADRLAAQFGIDHSMARSDVETLLDRLRELGVVR